MRWRLTTEALAAAKLAQDAEQGVAALNGLGNVARNARANIRKRCKRISARWRWPRRKEWLQARQMR